MHTDFAGRFAFRRSDRCRDARLIERLDEFFLLHHPPPAPPPPKELPPPPQEPPVLQPPPPPPPPPPNVVPPPPHPPPPPPPKRAPPPPPPPPPRNKGQMHPPQPLRRPRRRPRRSRGRITMMKKRIAIDGKNMSAPPPFDDRTGRGCGAGVALVLTKFGSIFFAI